MIDPQTCTKCHTRNPVGNKFCRECGEALPVSENPMLQEEAERAQRERTQERVAGLLASAFRKSEAREFEEALRLAEEAAELMPQSTSAYALLATLYERTHQNDKAVAAMERVVELNPASAADRLKLEQLRRGVHVSPAQTGKPLEYEEKPRLAWLPLAAAGGIAAVVFGVLMALVGAKDEPKRIASARTQPQYSPTFAPSAPMANTAPPFGANPAYSQPGPIITPYPIEKLNPSPAPTARTATRPRGRASSAPGRMSLPLPGEVNANQTVPPVTLEPPPPDQYGNGFGNGGRVTVGPPAVGSPTVGDYPQTNPGINEAGSSGSGGGYIRIQVNPAKGNTPLNPPANENPPAETPQNPTANPPVSENELPLSRARRLQSEGRYNEAIAAYREAIRNGMGAGDTYLGIAQSYQRLGDTSAARGAYSEAINAYENQISAGRSAGSAREGIATCRAALDVLGG